MSVAGRYRRFLFVARSLFGLGVAVALVSCQRQQPVGPVTPAPPRKSAPSPTPAVAEPAQSAAAADENAAAPQPAPLFENWPKPAIAFVLTGQQIGYIEPCGCTGLENQKGGLARRHTLIKQLADDRGWPVVPLDVGSQVKRFGKQQEIKFDHTVKGLRTMGYRALTLGDGDLKLSPGELLAAIAGADGTVADVVSSNVAVLARDLMPQSLVIEAGGKKIGVTAVLGEKHEQKLRGDELVHEPPLAALKKIAPELQSKQCDLYVLLAHAPLDEARKLAQDVPMFDLVVASGENTLPSRELESIEGTKTRLLQLGQKAMYVGVLGVFDDPQNPFRYESVPLDARFADSPAMLKLLADYQEQLKDLGFAELGIKPQLHASGRKFVGSEKCGECHSKAFEKWSSTPHAHATDSLVQPPNSRGEIARHYDPECLSCHVTGWEPQRYFPYDSGYLSLERTPQLQHNGCENCHGPGSAHVAAESGEGNPSAADIARFRDAMKLPIAGAIAEQKCVRCHDDDNSPDFHQPGAFEKYWKEVAHPWRD
jgi:Cytochrome c554 and c-prime